MKDLLLNVGSGGGAAAAAPGGAATGGGAADAPAEEEKAEEKAEGKSSHVNFMIMRANFCISRRKGGVGRGYGFWAVRLDTLFSWFTSYCNRHLAQMNIPSLQDNINVLTHICLHCKTFTGIQ